MNNDLYLMMFYMGLFGDNKDLLVNNMTFLGYFQNFLNICLGRFDWTGMPEELQGKNWYIENSLISQGAIGAVRDELTGKIMILRALPASGPNIYGEYTEYQLIGMNGFSMMANTDECVIGWDNTSRTNLSYVNVYNGARRVSDIQRTADVRLHHHKAPVFFSGNPKTKSSINEMIKKIDNNELNIIYDNTATANGEVPILGAVNNDVNFINNDLVVYKNQIIGEIMNQLGINWNPSQGKKERLVTDEVNSNNEMIRSNLLSYLKPRQEFCDRVNERFGTEMRCEYINPDKTAETANNEIKQEEEDKNDETPDTLPSND